MLEKLKKYGIEESQWGDILIMEWLMDEFMKDLDALNGTEVYGDSVETADVARDHGLRCLGDFGYGIIYHISMYDLKKYLDNTDLGIMVETELFRTQ